MPSQGISRGHPTRSGGVISQWASIRAEELRWSFGRRSKWGRRNPAVVDLSRSLHDQGWWTLPEVEGRLAPPGMFPLDGEETETRISCGLSLGADGGDGRTPAVSLRKERTVIRTSSRGSWEPPVGFFQTRRQRWGFTMWATRPSFVASIFFFVKQLKGLNRKKKKNNLKAMAVPGI